MVATTPSESMLWAALMARASRVNSSTTLSSLMRLQIRGLVELEVQRPHTSLGPAGAQPRRRCRR